MQHASIAGCARVRLPCQSQVEFGGDAASHCREHRTLRDPELSYVREISLTNNGQVSGAIYFDAHNKEIFQKAKAVVLSANGTETPRLLLLSKSKSFPDGLANSNGLVGKYLDERQACDASGPSIVRSKEYKGAVTGAAILDYVPQRSQARLLRRRPHDRPGPGGSPIQYGLRGPHGAPRWGSGYKKALKDQANRKLTITNFITQLPVETNRVDLDPE